MTGDYIVAALQKLQETQPLIGDVRGHGLFIGFELVTDKKVGLRRSRAAHAASC